MIIRIHNWGADIRDRRRNKRQVPSTSVDVVRDINYSNSNNPQQTLDIHTPRDTKSLGLVINVHGGAWVYGDKSLYSHYSDAIAEHGFTVANINYRLSPKNKIEDQLTDLAAVMEYFADMENIFLVGDSAGAHLISVYLTRGVSPNIRAAAFKCGVFDFTMLRHEIRWYMRPFVPRFIRAATNKGDFLEKYSALENMNLNFPPTYLMTSRGDYAKFMSVALGEKLAEHNVHHKYDEYPRGRHVFHLDIRRDDSKKSVQNMADFFKKHIN
ncbi:MAG: alpha/beta hydrolase [Firmicutes bacterium]|nr:alpha/beta hydrolase [Bacillota bacterium]